MKIQSKLKDDLPRLALTQQWRQVIEDHLPYLKKHYKTSMIEIKPMLSYKYAGDFYGLLYNLQIEPITHYAILRLNNLSNPAEFTGEAIYLYKPDTTVVMSLFDTMRTRVKKNIF